MYENPHNHDEEDGSNGGMIYESMISIMTPGNRNQVLQKPYRLFSSYIEFYPITGLQ